MKTTFRQMATMATLLYSLASPGWAQFTVPVDATVDMPAGTLVDLGCTPVQVQGNLNLLTTQMSTASNFDIAGTGVVNGIAGTLTVGGDLTSGGTFNAGTTAVLLTDGCTGGNTTHLAGTLVFQNLTLSSTSGRAFVIPAGSQITVLGTLTLQGTPAQPIQLLSSGAGTAAISLGPAAVLNQNMAIVAGNVQIGAMPADAAVRAVPATGAHSVVLLSLLLGLAALRYQRSGRTDPMRTPRPPAPTGSRRKGFNH